MRHGEEDEEAEEELLDEGGEGAGEKLDAPRSGTLPTTPGYFDAVSESRAPGGSTRGGRAPREPRKPRERRAKRPLGEVEPIEPGTVTALHERRAGSARYLVAVDGRDVATVSAQVIVALGIRVGMRVDSAQAEALRDESGRLEVFDKAVELLAVRARSVRDMRLRLRRAGATAGAIEGTVEQLTALGLLDDEAYARNLAHARAVGGGVSKRRIGQELQKRGVSREVADEAIDATLADVELDEMGAARAAAAKRMRSLRSLDEVTRRRRLYAFLARRGYEPAVIARVIKEIGAGVINADDGDEADDEEEDGAGE